MASENEEIAASADAPTDTAAAPSREEKHLNHLAICHYIIGALTAIVALPLIPSLLSAWEAAHWTGQQPLSERTVQLMSSIRLLPDLNRPEYDNQLLGLTLLIVLVPVVSLLVMHGILLATVGRWLARRRRYKTTIVISIFNLTNIPLGSVVSILTLIALTRPAVKRLYGLKPKADQKADS